MRSPNAKWLHAFTKVCKLRVYKRAWDMQSNADKLSEEANVVEQIRIGSKIG
jgi:hypothetical protein